MTFNDATDQLTRCVTLGDLAAEMGASHGLIRQARMSPESSAFRHPPRGWEKAVARLARERGGELLKLADELEPNA